MLEVLVVLEVLEVEDELLVVVELEEVLDVVDEVTVDDDPPYATPALPGAT